MMALLLPRREPSMPERAVHSAGSQDSNLVNLQECLSAGRPLLIENIDQELDPVLDPVLERRFVRKGRLVTVQLADKEVPS